LPDYAVQIVTRYKRGAKQLLPQLSVARLNQNIKELVERAGWIHPVAKVRMRRGKPVAQTRANGKSYRFCDLVSTHTMRRTAITTMLRFGMPELMVRRISGHKDGSKEFYKYVRFAQSYQDQETDKVFSRFRYREREDNSDG
jgi:integrase